MPGLLKRKVVVEHVAIGFVEEPTIVVSGIPPDAEVGDEISPSVNVMRVDGITPVQNVMVDFFVIDVVGHMSLGDRQLTDVGGDAAAQEAYYVSAADADTSVTFRIVLRAHHL